MNEEGFESEDVSKRKRNIIITICIVVVIIGLLLLIFLVDWDFGKTGRRLTESQQACYDLGCEEGSEYVGSVNSDKYYECSCHYAKRIKIENIVCYETKEQAETDNRIWVDC